MSDDRAKTNVLVIDDSITVRRFVSKSLEGLATIHETGTAAAGLDVARLVQPDVILVDSSIGGEAGIDVCRRIAGFPELELVPLLLMSSRGYEAIEGQEPVSSLRFVLQKPFDRSVLVFALGEAARWARGARRESEMLAMLERNVNRAVVTSDQAGMDRVIASRLRERLGEIFRRAGEVSGLDLARRLAEGVLDAAFVRELREGFVEESAYQLACAQLADIEQANRRLTIDFHSQSAELERLKKQIVSSFDASRRSGAAEPRTEVI